MSKIKDVLYSPDYLKTAKDLQSTSDFVCSQLSRENLKRISAQGLSYVFNRCDKEMGKRFSTKDFYTVQFALDELIFGKAAFEKRLQQVSQLLEMNDWEIAPLLFFTAPKFFFLPTRELLFFAEKNFNVKKNIENYYSFNQKVKLAFSRSEEKKTFASSIEFCAALKIFYSKTDFDSIIDQEDQKMIEEMLESIKKFDLFRIESEHVRWLKELYKGFNREQKRVFLEEAKKEKVHPYIRRLITEDSNRGVVVDGSNIMFAGLLHPDPARFVLLFHVMGSFDPLLFPVFFVFDANADYLINSNRSFWERNFLNNPSVFFRSPADGFIIRKAYEKHYLIISNDKFRDHGQLPTQVLRFEPEKEKFYFQ